MKCSVRVKVRLVRVPILNPTLSLIHSHLVDHNKVRTKKVRTKKKNIVSSVGGEISQI
jgi:hypothetical protein